MLAMVLHPNQGQGRYLPVVQPKAAVNLTLSRDEAKPQPQLHFPSLRILWTSWPTNWLLAPGPTECLPNLLLELWLSPRT